MFRYWEMAFFLVSRWCISFMDYFGISKFYSRTSNLLVIVYKVIIFLSS